MLVGFWDVLYAIGQIGHVDAQDTSGHDDTPFFDIFLIFELNIPVSSDWTS
jgi:hypothetical protein